MEYDKLFIEQKNIPENSKKYVIKKNNINIILFNNLKYKINELESKLDFYSKYENNVTFNDSIDSNIINVINNIDNLINIINKNIINNGQLNKKNKYIEYEF